MAIDYIWLLPTGETLIIPPYKIHSNTALEYFKNKWIKIPSYVDEKNVNSYCINNLGWIKINHDSIQVRNLNESTLYPLQEYIQNNFNVFSRHNKLYLADEYDVLYNDLNTEYLEECDFNIKCAIAKTQRANRFIHAFKKINLISKSQLIKLKEIFEG